MPLLARNVYMQGYEGGNRPTEFLILLNRYVQQARELATLAGSEEVIRVAGCEDAKPLLHTLGYRGAISVEHEPEDFDPTDDCKANLAMLREWLRH